MRLPNQFLIYVSDAASAAAFYGELFDAKSEVLSPRYMTFDRGGGVVRALWSGKSRDLDPATPRNFEVGILVDGGSSETRAIYDEWVAKSVEVVEELNEDVRSDIRHFRSGRKPPPRSARRSLIHRLTRSRHSRLPAVMHDRRLGDQSRQGSWWSAQPGRSSRMGACKSQQQSIPFLRHRIAR